MNIISTSDSNCWSVNMINVFGRCWMKTSPHVNKPFSLFKPSSFPPARMGNLLLSSRRNFLLPSWDMRSPSESPVECTHQFHMKLAIRIFARWNCFHSPYGRFQQNIPKLSNASRRWWDIQASTVQCRWERNLIWSELRIERKHESSIKWVIQLMWIDMSDLHRR